MRNWNCLNPIVSSNSGTEFLDYLWGIETRMYDTIDNGLHIVFLDYLWGIETDELYSLPQT